MESTPASAAIVPVGQFLTSVVDLGIVAADELERIVASLSEDKRYQTKAIAQELMRQGLLTTFQTNMLCRGRSRESAPRMGGFLFSLAKTGRRYGIALPA